MIPVLYEFNETSFLTNGIGRLTDAIYCRVVEKRNGGYELEMKYPVTGIHYQDLRDGRLIYARHDDTTNKQPFRIYRITRPIDGKVTVYARHRTYDLNKIILMPCSSGSVDGAMAAIPQNTATTCGFTFWTDKSTRAAWKCTVPSSVRSVLGGQAGSILDVFGGEYEWDNTIVRLYEERGSDSGVTIAYRKNMTGLTADDDSSNVWTGIVPFWKGDDGSTGETVVTLPEKVVYSRYRNNFTQDWIVQVDLSSSFENKPNEAQLRTAAQAYVRANEKEAVPRSIKVSFVALWQTEEYASYAPLQRLRLCDTVTIRHEELGIQATAKIIETVYNVLLERYDSMTVGDSKSTLATSIRGVSDELGSMAMTVPTKTDLRLAAEHATELLRGGLGGNVVTVTDANGKPVETLYMDTDDIQTAVNVLRINMNGIGFSSNGYNGLYKSAWTLDGNFVADFITTGTLRAGLIKAGILTDGQGLNFWNMETGEFSLSAAAKVGGKTVATIASEAVDAQTQRSIFNKLTNNGATMGIYLDSTNNKLYINASYIATGILADAGNNTTFNLSDGTLTMKKGSINIGSGKFVVTPQGALTCTGADVNGKVTTKSGNNWSVFDAGYLKGGTDLYSSSTEAGYISFNQHYSNTNTYGTRLAGRGMVAILTPVFAVGSYVGMTTSASAYQGITRNVTVVTGINYPNVDVTLGTDHLYNIAQCDAAGNVTGYYGDIEIIKRVTVSVTPNWNQETLGFKSGLLNSW